MKWTSDKPTQPGWYWWRSQVFPILTMFHVIETSDYHFFVDNWGGGSMSTLDMDGQWSGPLEPPTEGGG